MRESRRNLSFTSLTDDRSFLAGSLPLTFSLSPTQLRLISTVGMGVLVGTSLVVIIPEGIETLYSAQQPAHTHHSRSIYSKALDVRWNPSNMVLAGRAMGKDITVDHADPDAFKAMPGPVVPDAFPGKPALDSSTASTTQDMSSKAIGEPPPPPKNAGYNHDKEEGSSPHAYVGIAMIFGFILMYLIDQVPRHASANAQAHQQPYHISLDNLAQGLHRPSPVVQPGEQNGYLDSQPSAQTNRAFSTTVGLVIHAAADGIALGASSSTANMRLGFIIFVAIMVHKAPAAFGLTAVLLKQGLSKREARSHLIIFSLAAPAGALATWTIVRMLGQGRMGGEEGTQWWTGILLLFSAGTFL